MACYAVVSLSLTSLGPEPLLGEATMLFRCLLKRFRRPSRPYPRLKLSHIASHRI